jgi:hypothetical protein
MMKNVENTNFNCTLNQVQLNAKPIVTNFTFDHMDTLHTLFQLNRSEYRQTFLYAKSSLPCILYTESTKDQQNVGGQVQQLMVIQQTHQHFIHY